MKKNLEYIGEALNYRVYKNAEGILEGYRSKGRMRKDETWTDMERVVTNATDMVGFEKFIKGMKKRPEKKLDKSKFQSLFND